MTPQTIESIDKEIDDISKVIEDRRKDIRKKKNERRSLLRQERDQLRYIVGGLILGNIEDFEKLFPGLLDELYSRADTRDKIKFVRGDFIDEDALALKEQNKKECQKSVLAIESSKGQENLKDEDKKKLEKIKQYLVEHGGKIQTKLYGKSGEVKVYTGPNKELRISDELAAFLRDEAHFSE